MHVTSGHLGSALAVCGIAVSLASRTSIIDASDLSTRNIELRGLTRRFSVRPTLYFKSSYAAEDRTASDRNQSDIEGNSGLGITNTYPDSVRFYQTRLSNRDVGATELDVSEYSRILRVVPNPWQRYCLANT